MTGIHIYKWWSNLTVCQTSILRKKTFCEYGTSIWICYLNFLKRYPCIGLNMLPYVGEYKCSSMSGRWDNLKESLFSPFIPPCGSKNWSQMVSFLWRHIHLLTHLVNPLFLQKQSCFYYRWKSTLINNLNITCIIHYMNCRNIKHKNWRLNC